MAFISFTAFFSFIAFITLINKEVLEEKAGVTTPGQPSLSNATIIAPLIIYNLHYNMLLKW